MKIGLIPGRGNLPRRIIEGCRTQDIPLFILGVQGQTSPHDLGQEPAVWCPLGQIRSALYALRRVHVTHIVMCGYFDQPRWSDMRPDSLGLLWIGKLMKAAVGDNSLLHTLAELFEKEGFTVIGPEDIIGMEILAPQGTWTHTPVPPEVLESLKYGFQVAKALGSLDIGQSIVMEGSRVLGVEAVEGTNELMARCGLLKGSNGPLFLLKTIKPHQDQRIDRPTIGQETLVKAIEYGFNGIIVESGEVFVLDYDKMILQGNEHHLFLGGFKPE